MTTKIDELNTHYLIPGSDLGPIAVEDSEVIEEDYTDAPYSQMPPVSDMPSPTGWQDMLGLNQTLPDPRQIDPPPRPTSLERGTTANATGDSPRLLGDLSRDGMGEGSTSPKIERMMDMLAGYDETVRRLRARASKSGGQ